MSTIDKVCPVVFRDASMRQILAFEHPRRGVQLVKGGVEPGESVRAAALPASGFHRLTCHAPVRGPAP